jgi:adenylyl-sulfate kinase
MSHNIVGETQNVTKEDRQKLLNQKSPVIWLTGLSGSGKSTIANKLASKLHNEGKLVYVLNRDDLRLGLNKDLDFSTNGRKENTRRIAEVARLMSDAGIIVITAFISPFEIERENAKMVIGEDNFIEVYIKADLEVCEKRDPEGLYKKARAGEIPMFTGVDSPYEEPYNPSMFINTNVMGIDDSVNFIYYNLDFELNKINEVYTLDKKKTIAIDFDGVIHKYSKGFRGLDDVYDSPMDGVEYALKELYDEGYTLKILSSRPKEVIYPWLKKYGLSQYITEVSNHKLPATVYIDDRGFLFENWGQCLTNLKYHPKLKN